MAGWQSGQGTGPKSKRTMVAALRAPPTAAKLSGRNTLDYVGADGRRRIRLHSTDIITFDKRGTGFTIDTGGWNTPTTRDRLNAFLPGARVGARKGRLYLGDQEFRRTIIVSATGKIKSDVSPKAADKLAKQVDAYMAAWRKRGLPTAEESGGDPWIFTEGKVEQHVMRDWVKSRYVHRRLLPLAMAYAGFRPEGIDIWMAMADLEGMRTIDYGRIRRYVRACLGL